LKLGWKIEHCPEASIRKRIITNQDKSDALQKYNPQKPPAKALAADLASTLCFTSFGIETLLARVFTLLFAVLLAVIILWARTWSLWWEEGEFIGLVWGLKFDGDIGWFRRGGDCGEVGGANW
jgi:hypothetical protein